MGDEGQKNIAVALLVATGLILFLSQKQGDRIPLAGLAALAIIGGVTFMTPLIGLALAIPIFAVVWFTNQKVIWDWWAKIQKISLNIGGN